MIHDVLSRVVEVRTPTDRGTGYQVTGDLVLTASHVIADDDHLHVVTRNGQRAGIVVWRHPVLDAALVRVAADRVPQPEIRTRWAAVGGVESVGCTAIGYPRAQRAKDCEPGDEQIEGFVMPGAGIRTGRYLINIKSALPYESRTSPWSGMSGAAVLSTDGRHVLGLLTHDPVAYETSRIEAVPVAALVAESRFQRLVDAGASDLITLTAAEPGGSAGPGARSRGSEQAWRARIETAAGSCQGFLVDATHVVTRAGGLRGGERVRVTFPHTDHVPHVIEATVRSHDGIAVAELAEPAPVEPAALAGPAALRDRGHHTATEELLVHGVPRGYRGYSADVRVCAPRRSLAHAEPARLVPLDTHAVPLDEGFHGSAVTLAGTGAVVGMVVGTGDGTPGGAGEVLPLEAIRMRWPALDDLVPLGPLAADVARELRRLFEGIEVTAAPADIYRASLPSGIGPEPPPLESLWEAARFAAEETLPVKAGLAEHPVTRFCVEVLRHVTGRRRRDELRRWIRDRLGVTAGVPDDAASLPGSGLIVVRVEDRSGRYLVSIGSYCGDDGHQVENRMAGTEKDIRAIVERKLPDALGHIPKSVTTKNVLMQFELPLALLSRPVDEWYAGPRRYGQPIGSRYQVVVRDSGLEEVAVDRDRLVEERWAELARQSRPEMHPVHCRDRRAHQEIAASLEGALGSILTLSAAPRNPRSDRAVRAGLSVGLPVMLWTRDRCSDDHADACGGDRFLDALRRALASTAPRDLPDRMRELRRAARVTSGEPARYRAVTLFWHDPALDPPEPRQLIMAN